MVDLLLRLRFRVLANTLARSPFQLAAVLLGSFTALPLLLSAFGLLWIAPGVDVQLPVAVPYAGVVIGGAAIVLGWCVLPVVVNGIEQTLDPARLAAFPLRTGQLLAAQLLVGVTWVPGATTILAGLMTVVAWRAHPDAALAAPLSGLVGAVTAIAGSRMVATLTGNLLAGRRVVIRIAVIGALLVALAGPAVAALAVGLTTPVDGFRSGADVLAFSPIGAAWAVPGWIAAGFGAQAAISAAVAVLSLAAIVAVWWFALRASLGHRGTVAARSHAGGRLGAFRWLPATPWGAIWARSLIYWFRDPRYARQLAVIPVLPALTLLFAAVTDQDWLGFLAGPEVAALLPLSIFAGISYDGTAWAAQLAAGTRGLDDRIGRTLGLATIAVPAVIAVQLIVVAVLDAWSSLPALLGLCAGALLTALGVVAVSSARVVIPVPRSGRNPFSASAGAGTTSIVGSYAVTGAAIGLMSPELVLGIVALVSGSALLGWITLAVGVGLGAVVAVVGVLLGGAWLDRRAPATLARLRAVRV